MLTTTEARPPAAPRAFEIVDLVPADLCFRYAGENVTLRLADGRFFPRVTLRKCFPLSGEGTWITVRYQSGDENVEIGVIEAVMQLDAESRKTVLRELRRHYLVPQIQRISAIREEFGYLFWTVETDRGPREVIMHDNIIANTREVSPGRWLIIDINQARYEIFDLNALDAPSQKLLKRCLLL